MYLQTKEREERKMARIYLDGMDLGVVDLKAYGYTVSKLEACGYRVEVL